MAANAFWLISGDILGQAISFATMPIITHLYTPADFGIFSVILSVIAILGPVSTLRFNEVIILSKGKIPSWNALALSCLSCITIASLSMLVVCLISYSPWLLKNLNLEAYHEYLWIIPIGILLRGFTISFNELAEWQKKFNKLSLTPVLFSLVSRTQTIALGFFMSIGAWGLICGRLSGLVVIVVYLAFLTIGGEWRDMVRGITYVRLKKYTLQYKEFPIFGSWSIMLNAAARESIVFLLIALFSPATAGLYSLSKNMIYNPMRLIGFSLNRIFRQRAVAIKNDHNKLIFETKRFIGYMSLMVLPVILILLFLGDRIFIVVFGDKWQEAGIYAQILAPSLFFTFIYNIMRSFFVLFEKPRLRLISDTCYFLTRGTTLLFVGLISHSPKLSLLFLSLVTSIFVLCFLVLITYLLKIHMFSMLKLIMMKFITMIPLIIGLVLIRTLLGPYLMLSIVVLSLTLIIQAIVVVSGDQPLRVMTLNFLYEKTKIPFFKQ